MVDKSAHYLMCKGGVYYFTRHVPNDLQRHYEKLSVIILCPINAFETERYVLLS